MARRRHNGAPRTEAALRALRALLAGNTQGAEAVLTEMARADSSRAGVYLALARLYRRRGEIGRAIRIHQNLLLRGAALSAEERVEAQRGLAHDFVQGGFLRRAQAATREWQKLAPKNPEALHGLAQLHLQLHEFEEAAALQKKLARLQPQQAAALETRLQLARAQAAAAAGDSKTARKTLRQLLKRTPQNAAAWLQLGETELAAGAARAALSAFGRALQHDANLCNQLLPQMAAAAKACEGDGGGDEYEALLRAHVQGHPAEGAARAALAAHLQERGQAEAAAREVQAGLQQAPEHPQLLCAQARLLCAEGRAAEAGAALQQLARALAAGAPQLHGEALE